MAKRTVARMRALEILTAKRALKAAQKYLAKLRKKGVQPEHLARLKETIAEAERLEAVSGRLSLMASRKALKELLAEMRVAGDLFARGFEGEDKKAEKALGLDQAFPDNDSKLAKAVERIDEAMATYGAQLAAHDFDKKKQDQLVKAAAAFIAEVEAKPVKRGERRADTTERETVFARLRHETGWLRRTARAALSTSKASEEFDRIVDTPAKAATKRKTAPEAKAAKVAKKPRKKKGEQKDETKDQTPPTQPPADQAKDAPPAAQAQAEAAKDTAPVPPATEALAEQQKDAPKAAAGK